MQLLNPDKYKGYKDHPALDNTLRQVKSATILPDRILGDKGWMSIVIEFEDGERYSSCSPSVRGAKQQFAFQCEKGSKWELIK